MVYDETLWHGDDINVSISVNNSNEHCLVQLHEVADAVSRLKSNKNDGNKGLNSNHVCFCLFVCLSGFFTAHQRSMAISA